MPRENLITEQFLTIQGEGRSLGQVAYFIRFAGCNLRCEWCDSLHSVDPALFAGRTAPIDYARVPDHCELIVLTGGEPTLFDLMAVRERLAPGHPGRRFEVESNATVFPREIVDHFHWNLSPKLASSGQRAPSADARRLAKLGEWADYARDRDNVTFKFVIARPDDLAEVRALVSEWRLPATLICLMPEGRYASDQDATRVDWIVEACKTTGYRFSPRLHVMLWGDRRGV